MGGHDARVEIIVEDEGPGIGDTGNLFVPFFTTKSGGSGIGLVLSRQIAESHGGTLLLENRRDLRRGRVSSFPWVKTAKRRTRQHDRSSWRW